MGLYDTDFTSTPPYEELLIDFSHWVTTKGVWQHLSRGKSYKPVLTKVSFLTQPDLRYIYIVITLSFAGRGDSIGVIRRQELLFLFSLVEHPLIHVGYVFIDFITYQGWHDAWG